MRRHRPVTSRGVVELTWDAGTRGIDRSCRPAIRSSTSPLRSMPATDCRRALYAAALDRITGYLAAPSQPACTSYGGVERVLWPRIETDVTVGPGSAQCRRMPDAGIHRGRGGTLPPLPTPEGRSAPVATGT